VTATEHLLAVLSANFAAAGKTMARLQHSLRAAATLLPADAARVTALTDIEMERLDALLKRYEQAVDALQNGLFKGIAALSGEDVAALSRRDVADVMERLGALPDAARWTEAVLLRNRLAHDYPMQPERQAARLNAVLERGAWLLQVFDQVGRYLEPRLPTG
jgi:hypothetical protein